MRLTMELLSATSASTSACAARTRCRCARCAASAASTSAPAASAACAVRVASCSLSLDAARRWLPASSAARCAAAGGSGAAAGGGGDDGSVGGQARGPRAFFAGVCGLLPSRRDHGAAALRFALDAPCAAAGLTRAPERREALQPTLRALVAALWRSRLAGEAACAGGADPLLSCHVTLRFRDGAALQLGPDLVARLAAAHAAAPSEHQASPA